MLRQLLLSLIHIFRLVFSDLSTIVREYEGSVDWIESLKARDYHTYYLSNYGERIRREASKELSFLSHMDGGIMSYTVHLAKPDPAIYQTLLDRYGLNAEECVFPVSYTHLAPTALE